MSGARAVGSRVSRARTEEEKTDRKLKAFLEKTRIPHETSLSHKPLSLPMMKPRSMQIRNIACHIVMFLKYFLLIGIIGFTFSPAFHSSYRSWIRTEWFGRALLACRTEHPYRRTKVYHWINVCLPVWEVNLPKSSLWTQWRPLQRSKSGIFNYFTQCWRCIGLS